MNEVMNSSGSSAASSSFVTKLLQTVVDENENLPVRPEIAWENKNNHQSDTSSSGNQLVHNGDGNEVTLPKLKTINTTPFIPFSVQIRKEREKSEKIANEKKEEEVTEEVKEAYIPLKLAKSKIESIMKEIVTMKEIFSQEKIELERKHKKIEEEMQKYYIDYIEKLKEKSKFKIEQLNQSLHLANNQMKELKHVEDEVKRANDLEIEKYRSEIELLTSENKEMKEKLSETLRDKVAQSISRVGGMSIAGNNNINNSSNNNNMKIDVSTSTDFSIIDLNEDEGKAEINRSADVSVHASLSVDSPSHFANEDAKYESDIVVDEDNNNNNNNNNNKVIISDSVHVDEKEEEIKSENIRNVKYIQELELQLAESSKMKEEIDLLKEQLKEKEMIINELKENDSEIIQELKAKITKLHDQYVQRENEIKTATEIQIKQVADKYENDLNAIKSKFNEEIQKGDKKTEMMIKEYEVKNEEMANEVDVISNELKIEKECHAEYKSKFNDAKNQIKSMMEEIDKLNIIANENSTLKEEIQMFKNQVEQAINKMEHFETMLKQSQDIRKKLLFEVEEMKGKVRVYLRIRPFSKREIENNSKMAVKIIDDFSCSIQPQKAPEAKLFKWSSLFGTESTQEQVFKDTKNLIQAAVDGYNVCIFAYGQTGSGKTFTLYGVPGDSELEGIAPRAMKEIFEIKERDKTKKIEVSCYMVELYRGNIIDLFFDEKKSRSGERPKLTIKKDPRGMIYIQNAEVLTANTLAELQHHLDFGNDRRHTAETKMNAASSRSHSIFAIRLDVTNLKNGKVTSGKLNIVDLAGSEKVSKTEASGDTLKEAQEINKSLSALGNVIYALSTGKDFIPYRDSKLTEVMQDSLGGNAKTLMFVNCSPADWNSDESYGSMMYGSRVREIKNEAYVSTETKDTIKFKARIKQLDDIIYRFSRGEKIDLSELENGNLNDIANTTTILTNDNSNINNNNDSDNLNSIDSVIAKMESDPLSITKEQL